MFTTFAEAAVNMTFTENGAVTNSTTKNARVDMFFGILRGCQDVHKLCQAAWSEDPLHTLKIMAYIRDCRGGKGERKTGRQCLEWLAVKQPDVLAHNLHLFLSTYGRYDDGLVLIGTPQEKILLQFLSKQLRRDLAALKQRQDISLCAKWIPSQQKSADKKTKVHKKLCRHMGVNAAELRKRYLSPLRKQLNILERAMCAKEWESINFNAVPSVAMHIHGKQGNAFERHLDQEFTAWKAKLASGETKVNAKVLFPHQVVERYLETSEPSDLLEAQWKVMLEKGADLGDFSRTLVLSDVSGSMYGMPMVISLTLGILISQLSGQEFKNLVLTFESKPRFHKVTGNTLFDRIQSLKGAPWGGSTDFIAAMNQIVQLGVRNKIPAEKMPNRLIVVSDMQFNIASEGNFETNYQSLVKEFQQSGYPVPHLVFWNVRGSITDFPALSDDFNVSLVSGFSIDVLKAVLSGENLTPFQTMMMAILDARYDAIQLPPSSSDDDDFDLV